MFGSGLSGLGIERRCRDPSRQIPRHPAERPRMSAPRLAHLGLLDFHRAREAIEAGERAVEAALPSLNALFSPSP